MWDLNLQMRFWRSLTEAMLEATTASLAAASEFQTQMLEDDASRKAKASPAQAPAFNPFEWWQAALAGNPFLGSPASAPREPAPATMFWNPWVPVRAAQPADQWMKFYTDLWTRPQAWVASTPWAVWQTPMTMMLMSFGMPHSVASPAARASAASLDAADAAQQQLQKVYSAYRSDGGHAATQLIVMPWAIAASFMTGTFEPDPFPQQPPPSRWRH